ncbi:MAG: sensor histidine kinase [bacterium]
MKNDYHWFGLLGSISLNLFWLLSVFNLWKVRHMDGLKYLIISILIYGTGTLIAATQFIEIPTMPIAILLSNIFMWHVIIGKRIISPLREKSIKLEQEIIKRIHLEKNIQSVQKDRLILLNEVHHRVRNNLQIISSLAHFHSVFLSTHNTQDVLKRFEDLMQSMSFVHNYIYENNNLSKINFSKFINDVISNIRMTSDNSDKLKIKQNIKNINLPLDKAIPCGMVLYELIFNIYKHAFPEYYNGEPTLFISAQNISSHTYEIIVNDNGIGLPENFNPNNINSIGLKLVKILIEGQLDGSIEVINGKGVTFRLVFENK